MSISELQYRQMLERTQKTERSESSDNDRCTSGGQVSERNIHDDILKWCDSQWPRVKYIHARTDRPSTIAVGAHDITLFLPRGQVLCLEVKRRDGKLSTEQLSWCKQMHDLNHTVHVVRSFEDFKRLIPCDSKKHLD